MLRLRDHLEPREKNRKKKRVKEKKRLRDFLEVASSTVSRKKWFVLSGCNK